MLNWADYSILGVVGLSTAISLVRGFVREALSLVIWVAAFWVAATFAQDLAELLCDLDVRKRAEALYDRFYEEMFDEYYTRHNIPTALLGEVQTGLQRLSIEQYVRDLLDNP